MLVGLLLVAIYRPERICLPGMFRLSCVLLAVSIPVTAVTTFLMNAMIDVTGNGLSRMGNAPDSPCSFPCCKSSSRSWSG